VADEGEVMDEAGSRKSYEQLVSDKEVMRVAIKRLNGELSFNIEELVRSEAEVEKLKAKKAQTCESLGYHICGGVGGDVRKALELVWEKVELPVDVRIVVCEALKGSE